MNEPIMKRNILGFVFLTCEVAGQKYNLQTGKSQDLENRMLLGDRDLALGITQKSNHQG